MGNKIGVDVILTFDPEGYFQGYKVYQLLLHNWPTIADQNA